MSAEKKKPETKEKKPRRSWRYRLLRAGVILVALLVLVRVLLPVATPFILDSVAEDYGLAVEYDSLSLGILAGEVELRGLVVTRIDGGETVARLRLARVDVDTTSLFADRIVVDRVEVDGFELTLERDEAGRWPLLEALAQAPSEPEEEEEEEERKPLSLDTPVEVRAVRVQDVRVHVRDAMTGFDTRIDATVMLTDLGAADAPVRLEIEVAATNVLEALRVRGSASLSPNTLVADLDVRVRGLRPGPVATYLEPFGIRPTAELVEVGLASRVEATVIGEDSVSAQLTVRDVSVTADGATCASLGSLVVGAKEIGPTVVDLETVSVMGVRWRGARLGDGGFETCGFALVPVVATSEVAAPPAATEEEGPVEPMRLTLAELRIEDVRAVVSDPSRKRPLDVRVIEMRLDGYEAGKTGPLDLHARLAAPGIVEEVRLEGRVAPFSEKMTVALDVKMTGIESEPFADGLAAAGVVTTFDRADVTCAITAEAEIGDTIRAAFQLTDLKCRIGSDDLALGVLSVTEFGLAPESGDILIGGIALGGLAAALGRDAAGVLHGPGFRLEPPISAPANEGVVAEAPAPAASEVTDSPRIEIYRLIVAGNEISFRDETTSPATDLDVSDIRLEIQDLVLGREPAPARLGAGIEVPGVVERLSVSGTVSVGTASVAADLDVACVGITAERVDAYLAAAGLASEFESGDLKLHLAARIETGGEALEADLTIDRLELVDGGTELAGCDAVRVEGVSVGPERIEVGAVTIDRPRARVRRDAEGVLHLLGLRLIAPPPGPGSSPASRAGVSAASGEATPVPNVALDSFRLNGAQLRLTDESGASPVTVTPILDVTLGRTTFIDGQVSADGRLVLVVAEEMTRLAVNAKATATADSTHVEVDIEGEELRIGDLAAYLPPGLAVTLRDGRLRSRIEATIAKAEGGGRLIRAEVKDMDYRDGESETPLLAFDSLKIDVPRLDPDGGVIAIEEVSLSGLVTSAQKDTDGALHLLGLELTTPPPGPSAIDDGPAVGTPAAPRASLRDRLRESAETALPDVTVGRIDLRVSRLSFTDAAAPDPRPVTIENLRLHNPKPLAIRGETPEKSPPFVFEISGSISELVDSISIETSLGVFLDEPELDLAFALDGIQGAGLAQRVPALATMVDASQLRAARFGFTAHGVLRARRRHPLDFDLSNGFGVDMTVKNLALVNGDGASLAGIEEVHVDVTRVDPASGDVHVKTVEIIGPHGDVTREPGGLRVMGLLLREQVAAEAGPSPSADRPDASATVPPAAGPEIRVDSIYVSNLKSRITDVSVTPPFRMPIEDLTLEVRGFTTRAFTKRLPITFMTLVRTGNIEVFGDEEGKTVSPLEEIAVSGRLALFPRLDGWVKAGVSALDLANLGGLAKGAGVDLAGGVLDLGTSVRFRDDGAMETSTKISLIDLDLSEAPDGPISRVLRLPAPLNVVLFVLEDAGGAIDIPLNVRVEEDGVSGGAITGQAIKVLALLIADAVASSPFKVLGTAGGLLGFGSEEELPSDEPPLVLGFAAGDVMLRTAERETMRALVERMADEDDLAIMMEHEPGRGDLERLHARANPSREDCLGLLGQLRRRKREVLRARVTAEADARAAVAAGSSKTMDAARRHLSSLDHELGRIEYALDSVAALLRPGSERQAARRTREASVALANIRLREVQRVLVEAGIENVDARVRVRRPRATEPEIEDGGRVRIGLTRMKETD
jgi:Domain of Unknown Function (DUF748)